MALKDTLRFIVDHPLNRGRRFWALLRFAWWQLRSRLSALVTVAFVDDTVLVVSRGMSGATGNIYCGLHELEDMAFALHFLRQGDVFVDVGANVGSYTVLASATGADTVAFEPVGATFAALQANIAANGLSTNAVCAGVGRDVGSLPFSQDKGPMNGVSAKGTETPVTTLDASCLRATLIKIDVEGFESAVIAGGQRVLGRADAAIMELNGSGEQYGFDDDTTHGAMISLGFQPVTYDPFKLTLAPLAGRNLRSGNTIYVRDLKAAGDRVARSRRFRVHRTQI